MWANLFKVSVLFHEKRRTSFAFRGERGILYRFYTRRNTLIISALFFQKNAILPIFVANLSQDKAL